MISIAFVEGSLSREIDDIFHPFESFLESCLDDINTSCANFASASEIYALESGILGSASDKTFMAYESEKKSFFAKIGEMVISIYNKFAELIDKVVSSIKSLSFSKKSDLQKLDILIKKNPSLQKEAVAAFSSGALDLSDVKSLKELDSAFDEVLRMAKKKDVDPKSLRAKWDKAKEKFEKDEKTWTVVKVAAATTTIITAAIALKTFHSKCLKASNDAQKDKSEMNKRKAEVYQTLTDEGAIDENTGKFQTMLAIWRELNGKHSAARKQNMSNLGKLANSISEFVDKHSSDESKNAFHNDMKTTNRQESERKQKERDEKDNEVYRAQMQRNKADYEDMEKKAAQAYVNRREQIFADDNFKDKPGYNSKHEQQQAYDRKMGELKANAKFKEEQQKKNQQKRN